MITIFIGIQFFPSAISADKPVDKVITGMPEEVNFILQKSCYNCHSNNNNLQWFEKIAPVSWFVTNHIDRAKQRLNFSNWDTMEKTIQKAKLWESVNFILSEEMPLKSYTFFHPHAKVTSADLKILKEYVTALSPTPIMDSIKIRVLETQFNDWVRQKSKSQNQIHPMDINGIAYMPEYKNWTPIGTSQRLDNGTMRIIFGNDIAVQAIQNHQTNPWPDGTIIAKAAWEQVVNLDGNISTGVFKQVEYMIKDKQKYKTTAGWGWARFKTEKLIPYGVTMAFTSECISCHQPMKKNDFVFTEPFKTSK